MRQLIKGILFDFDETLLNRKHSVDDFVRDQYKRYLTSLVEIEEEQFCSRFIALDNNGYTWKDRVYEQLVDEYELTISSEALLEDYIRSFHLHCKPFNGLIDMLDSLKSSGYLLGLITNGRTAFQYRNIRALGIENYFDVILISEQEGVKKPEKVIFQLALERLDLKASQTVFIGDHEINDIKGASDAGMKTIWKKRINTSEELGEASIQSLLEIPQVIEEWQRLGM